jgi:hypothetical protein
MVGSNDPGSDDLQSARLLVAGRLAALVKCRPEEEIQGF